LASIHYPSAERLKEFNELVAAEKAAKAKKLGVWVNYDEEAEKAAALAAKSDATESTVGIGKSYEVIVTEVIDGSRFYAQIVNAESAGLEELVSQLTELSVTEGTGLPLYQPRVGELVRGNFTADDRWYRAKVIEIKGDKYKLQYIDYGNSEVVPASRIRQLPSNSNTLPHQAQLANLAYIKPLKEDNDHAGESREVLRDLAEGKKLHATLEYRDGNVLFLTLTDGDLNVTLEMLRKGVAHLVQARKRFLSIPLFVALREAEEEAKRRRLNIWYYGDLADSDEDEREAAPKKGGGKAAPAGKDAKPAAAPAAAAEKGGKKK